MQIEEKQIVINGQNIILRSPKKQDAETFSEVRDITYRETYFLARYPEETDFTAEAAEAMISDIAGRQLMEYAIENARKTELEQLKLGVFDDNVAAIRLYEKLGFREWGREPHAFKLKDGSYRDEIQMVLFLS